MLLLTLTDSTLLAGEQYLLSNGGTLQKVLLHDDKVLQVVNILNSKEWSHSIWPTYNEKEHDIYFQARRGSEKTKIYKTNLISSVNEATVITDGSSPSLSVDLRLMAFYRHPNELWIHDLAKSDEWLIAQDLYHNRPVVWITKNKLMYFDESKRLLIIDVETNKKTYTGHQNAIPVVFSSDKKKVLCVSYNGKSIILYSLKLNKIEEIIKTKFISIGSSFIWHNNDEGFLYSRQNWKNIFRFLERKDLYSYKFKDKKDVKLLEKVSLMGGTSIGYSNIQ